MTQEQKTATLATIFSEVLANLAFMFDDEEDHEPVSGEVWLETTIEYRGSVGGCLRFWCSRDFSVLLAANLLGVDSNDEDAGAQGEDAVREFMNIVCGQLVTAVYSADEVFNLTIPETRELAETPDLDKGTDGEVASLSVEGHCLQIQHILV